MKICQFLLGALIAVPAVAGASGLIDLIFGPREVEAITNTEMTAAGRRIPPASKSAPQYYIAGSGGYQELGSSIGGRIPPSTEVHKVIVSELAKRGYLPATPDTPPPTMAMILVWGTLNADLDTSDLNRPGVVHNRRQILRFLGAHQAGLDDSYYDGFTPQVAGLSLVPAEARNILEASTEDFYVVIVAAYDAETLRTKKPVLLWRTRIATFSRGIDFQEALPAMVAMGGAEFGRATGRPVWQRADEHFKPEVNPGPVRLMEYLDRVAKPAASGPGK